VEYRPACLSTFFEAGQTSGRHPLSWERAAELFSAGRGVRDMTSGPSLLELISRGDDSRVPARVDLEEDLDLQALVDRLELGAVVLFGQLVVYRLATDLPVTVQVGAAVVAVIVLNIVDRKLVAQYLE